MGKGVVAGRPVRPVDLWLGTAAPSERDYVHKAIDRADLLATRTSCPTPTPTAHGALA